MSYKKIFVLKCIMDYCKYYIEMLLATGFHKNTSPDIFRSDLKKLQEHCGKECISCKIVQQESFDPTRYFDLSRLKMSLKIDLIFYKCTKTWELDAELN
jgi:hypothetical protein